MRWRYVKSQVPSRSTGTVRTHADHASGFAATPSFWHGPPSCRWCLPKQPASSLEIQATLCWCAAATSHQPNKVQYNTITTLDKAAASAPVHHLKATVHVHYCAVYPVAPVNTTRCYLSYFSSAPHINSVKNFSIGLYYFVYTVLSTHGIHEV